MSYSFLSFFKVIDFLISNLFTALLYYICDTYLKNIFFYNLD